MYKPSYKDESDTDPLPNRLINPEEYKPVAPTTVKHTPDAEHMEPVNEDLLRRLTPVYTYGSIN